MSGSQDVRMKPGEYRVQSCLKQPDYFLKNFFYFFYLYYEYRKPESVRHLSYPMQNKICICPPILRIQRRTLYKKTYTEFTAGKIV